MKLRATTQLAHEKSKTRRDSEHGNWKGDLKGLRISPNSARIDIVLETDKGHRGGQFASCCKSFKLDGGGKHKKEVSKAKIDLFGQGP